MKKIFALLVLVCMVAGAQSATVNPTRAQMEFDPATGIGWRRVLLVDGTGNSSTAGSVSVTNTVAVTGEVASGFAASGTNPILIAGEDPSGDVLNISVDSGGDVQVDINSPLPTGTNTIGAVGVISNTTDFATETTLSVLSGSNSSIASDIGAMSTGVAIATEATLATMNAKFVSGTNIGAVDVNRLPVGATPDHGAVTVGSSATLIVAADSTRSSVTIINAFTNLVAIGNSDVTLNTVAATDGFVLATSGAANDGSGGTLTLNTTAAIYGIGASASSKVIYFTEAE